jgi:hypothetical protein
MPHVLHCCICKKGLPAEESTGHPLNPCALVLVAHADREWTEQKEQTFYCHFECFRGIVADDSILYIMEQDYSTNGEGPDEAPA